MRNKRVKALSLLLALTLCAGTLPAAAAVSFSDVPSDHWAYTAINYVATLGLLTGTSGTTFSPDMLVTQPQMCVLLARYAGVDITGSSPWYEKAMAWAEANGIIDDRRIDESTGYELHREDFVVMMYKFSQYIGRDTSLKEDDSLNRFRDSDKVSPNAVDAMKWAVTNGYIEGSASGYLDAGYCLRRAEVATILTRYVGEDVTSAPVYAGVYEPKEQMTEMPKDGTSVNRVVLDYDGNWSERLEFVRLVNELRVANGLNELKIAENAMSTAQLRAWENAYRGQVTHDSTKWFPSQSLVYWYNGEIATSSSSRTAQGAFNNFVSSPAHKDIMLDPGWEYIGVGSCNGHFIGGFAALTWTVQENKPIWLENAFYDPLLHN